MSIKKIVLSILLIAGFSLNAQEQAKQQLLNKIQESAELLAQYADATMNEESTRLLTSIFAIGSIKTSPNIIKQLEKIITENTEIQAAMGLLEQILPDVLATYKEYVEKNLENDNIVLSTEEFNEKFYASIPEVSFYVYITCYKALYELTEKLDGATPKMVFDENGIIPQAQRTIELPKP